MTFKETAYEKSVRIKDMLELMNDSGKLFAGKDRLSVERKLNEVLYILVHGERRSR